MLPYPIVLVVSLATIAMTSVIVYIATGSIMSVLVVLMLGGIVFYLLSLFGMFKVSVSATGLDIGFYESSPVPIVTKQIVPLPNAKNIENKEVFYISGNDYTYDDASAVCAAYDGELASYEQVQEAYSAGAEWCGYGWTQGGMALYPTQQATWETLQGESDTAKRTSCGRPGVNGGYFDPTKKFGVNCYGVKPKDHGTKFPLPPPGTDPNALNKYKSMLNTMTVAAFNRMGWSEWTH